MKEKLKKKKKVSVVYISLSVGNVICGEEGVLTFSLIFEFTGLAFNVRI